MKYFLVIILLWIFKIGITQNSDEHLMTTLYRLNQLEAQKHAQKHVDSGEVNLLIYGGEGPVLYGLEEASKYKIQYMLYGCLSPEDEVMLSYNYVVFDYLKEKYGNKWEKLIKKDAFGYKQWKKRK